MKNLQFRTKIKKGDDIMYDLQQQKNQIDEEARKAKEDADNRAVEARQLLANQESERVRREAERNVTQIQNDAQK